MCFSFCHDGSQQPGGGAAERLVSLSSSSEANVTQREEEGERPKMRQTQPKRDRVGGLKQQMKPHPANALTQDWGEQTNKKMYYSCYVITLSTLPCVVCAGSCPANDVIKR